ncbi:hypothetical protein NLJ89_g6354 [Agrocybe chaxingu]|uniref:Uncharacterized protein n=1 Tax=Agrocybe chaxingu TaxID=84603 RepID=A0A9W8MUQ4_9AGAR|nr:hypothetical protein NLJ89_g6354 [Agrocybe chaxingu]
MFSLNKLTPDIAPPILRRARESSELVTICAVDVPHAVACPRVEGARRALDTHERRTCIGLRFPLPRDEERVPMEFELGRAALWFGLAQGKRRESTRVRFAAEPSFSDVRQDIQVVGDDSWFVLEWLVALFEKDAEETEAQGQPRYSPLLLRQLPPPPMGSNTRWDASEPAKIVFYAFQQPDPRIQKIGLRLLLLVRPFPPSLPFPSLPFPPFYPFSPPSLLPSLSSSTLPKRPSSTSPPSHPPSSPK